MTTDPILLVECGLHIFNFPYALGQQGYEYITQQVREHEGEVIKASPDSAVVIARLSEHDAEWIRAIRLPHFEQVGL